MSVKSPIGRVAYPSVAKARQRKDTDKPRFSITLVYDEGTELKVLKNLCKEVADKKFPNGLPKNFRSPFRSGADREREDGSMPAGFEKTDTFVEFWRYEEHGVVPCVDANRNEILPSDVYAGMTGRVIARASAYSVDGNKGVSLHLEAFQKASDGTPIGSAPVNAQTAFDDIEGGDVAAAGVDSEDLW